MVGNKKVKTIKNPKEQDFFSKLDITLEKARYYATGIVAIMKNQSFLYAGFSVTLIKSGIVLLLYTSQIQYT